MSIGSKTLKFLLRYGYLVLKRSAPSYIFNIIRILKAGRTSLMASYINHQGHYHDYYGSLKKAYLMPGLNDKLEHPRSLKLMFDHVLSLTYGFSQSNAPKIEHDRHQDICGPCSHLLTKISLLFLKSADCEPLFKKRRAYTI